MLLGGLVVSTVFTLFLIPALFSLTMDAKQWFVRLIYGAKPAADQESDAKIPAVPLPQPAITR